MGKVRQSSEYVKKSIVETLYLLLEEKPYDMIKIYEVCEKSNVSKTSFYRYFQTKEDVLIYGLVDAWMEWCKTHKVEGFDHFSLKESLTFFYFNLSIRNYTTSLYNQGLDVIVIKSFGVVMHKSNLPHNYENRFYGYGLFGLIKEWCLSGYKETPEEMNQMLHSFFKD